MSPQRTEEISTADLRRENRQLRDAVDALLEALEDDRRVDCSKARAAMPDLSRDAISPPWERDGFDDKREWLDDRRRGPDRARDR